MTDAIVSIILKQITTILVEGPIKEVKLLRDVQKDVRKLKDNLEGIQALLEDAEEKQITNKAIKLWLDRLKHTSLDMEDALDEWRTTSLLLSSSGAAGEHNNKASFLRRKVRSFLDCFSFDHGVARKHSIACNIKEINARLDEIAQERDRHGLKISFEKTNNSNNNNHRKRVESTSLIDESTVLGRDEVKTELISHLLSGSSSSSSNNNNNDERIQTISVVGMGGLGKTAIAQLVYNDPEVKHHFSSLIWTCVSDVFDEIQVAKAILVKLKGWGSEGFLRVQLTPLAVILEEICDLIKGKKFLLILDDVWTEKESDFEALKLSFQSGAPGSRVLVTTRKEPVAIVMESQHIIHLETLSDELCWSILKKKALPGARGGDDDFEEVGRKIAEKCRGLPLVARTLGGLLQFKTTKQEWEGVLNSEMWKMDVVEKAVFVPLLLSYYDLPPPIRQCFTYCGVFAKDAVIYTCHLIAHWRAHGFLGIEESSSQPLELIGQEYYKILAARSFFQDFCELGWHPTCKMHDLVHEFALFMGDGQFMYKEVGVAAAAADDDDDESLNIPTDSAERTPRHLTLMIGKEVNFPSSISGSEKLRSVLGYGSNAVIRRQGLGKLFKQSKRLRLLEVDMEGYCDSSLPEEMWDLLHLRYFKAASSRITRLPDEISKLYNLEFLDLYNSALEELPADIGNLINLKLLRTNGCSNLTSYPKQVGKLTRLTQLIGSIVRVDRNDPNQFSLADLANLKHLMLLSMKLVGNKINVEESKKIHLSKLQELKIYGNDRCIRGQGDPFVSLNMTSVPLRTIDTDFYFHCSFTEPRSQCRFLGF